MPPPVIAYVKPLKMHLGENLSRQGTEHSEKSIRKLANEIVENDYWEHPHARKLKNGHELTAGFKRWHAALLLAQENRLPECVGNQKDGILIIEYVDRQQDATDAINAAENIDRENLNTYQVCHTLYELQSRHGFTNEDLAIRFSRYSPNSIRQYIRLAKKLIPEVQSEWKKREGTEHPLGLTILIRWMSLEPEDQLAALQSWKTRPLKFGRARNANDERRSQKAIEVRLSHESNPTARKTLLWVLNRNDEEEEEDAGRSNRNDRRGSANGTGDTASGTATRRGSPRDEGNRSLRKGR